MATAVVVPVFNPEPGLLELCRSLTSKFTLVIVVDDGSLENQGAFGILPNDVVILRHTVNRGKGRAIKTALEWLRNERPEVNAAVFADGDGQHRLEDIVAVAAKAEEDNHVVFGVRDFTKSNIPFRSRFGNVLTSFLVRLIFRFKIFDTQTGLRAIPSRMFDRMILLEGERYEYEMRIFGLLRALHEPLVQIPIETIYIDNNRVSHFRPIRDSILVYRGLFGTAFPKFIGSSILGFVVDNMVFTATLLVLQKIDLNLNTAIFGSLAIARAVSATLNYFVNLKCVFKSSSHFAVSFGRYWTLVALIAVLSYLGTTFLVSKLGLTGPIITAVKIVVEVVLFVLSFTLQKKWVFKPNK